MRTLVDGVAGGLPGDDPAVIGGLAVYEAVRTRDGRPHRLGAHLERLAAGAAWLGLGAPDEAALRADVEAALAGAAGESLLLLTLTGGGRRVVSARPLDRAREGAPVRVASWPFEAPDALPAWVKHTSRAAPALAARRAGVDEVLFVGRDGTWTEANKSNVLAVRGGVIFTPPADGRILAGVTRAELLAAALDAGIAVVEAPLVPGPSDELYLCSTVKGLAPVAQLDAAAGPGAGPVGTALWRAWHERMREYPEVDVAAGRIYRGAR